MMQSASIFAGVGVGSPRLSPRRPPVVLTPLDSSGLRPTPFAARMHNVAPAIGSIGMRGEVKQGLYASQPACMQALTNPTQSSHGGNGRTTSFSNGFMYARYGAPVQRLQFADCGLSKLQLMRQLAPLQERRAALRKTRREDHAAQRAAHDAQQREYRSARKAQREHARSYARQLEAQRAAAAVLQRVFRRRLAYAYTGMGLAGFVQMDLKERRARAAVNVQRRARGWLKRAERRLTLKAERELHACVTIQVVARRMMQMEDVSVRRARRLLRENEVFFTSMRQQLHHKAAVAIQACARGQIQRSETRTMRQFHEMRINQVCIRATIRLQTIWRGRKARERAKRRRVKGKGGGVYRGAAPGKAAR